MCPGVLDLMGIGIFNATVLKPSAAYNSVLALYSLQMKLLMFFAAFGSAAVSIIFSLWDLPIFGRLGEVSFMELKKSCPA